jgi:hypothetical protein
MFDLRRGFFAEMAHGAGIRPGRRPFMESKPQFGLPPAI